MRLRAGICTILLTWLPAAVPVAAQSTRPAPASQPAWPRFERLNFDGGFDKRQFDTYQNAAAGRSFWRVPYTWSVSMPGERSPQALARMHAYLRGLNSEVLIGRYFSAASVYLNGARRFPEESVPAGLFERAELLEYDWPGDPQRKMFDIRRQAVRDKFVRHVVETTLREGYRAISIDNISYRYWSPPNVPRAEWDAAALALLRALYEQARGQGLLLIVNVSTWPGPDWDTLSEVADGLTFEMPVHPNSVKKPADLEAELAAIRRVLERGKFVGLFPLMPPRENLTAAGKAEYAKHRTLLTAAYAMLIRNPGDRLAVCPRQWPPEHLDWFDWPAQFGAPRGGYRREGDEFTREFEQITLKVNFATERVQLLPRR